jgi:hypothetical protein
MNENIKNLAAFAGFALWENEAWNPGDVVDWSSRYDEQLIRFTTLIINTTLRLKEAGSDPYEYFGVLKNDQPAFENTSIDIESELVNVAMLAAHEKNITLNKYIEDILIKIVNETRKENSEND